MHFPGLSYSGSGPWVLHKGTDSVRPAFVLFPGPSSSGDQVLGERILPAGWCILSPPGSQPLSFLGAQQEYHLRCVSSGELISGCNPSGRCQCPGSQEDLVSNWEHAHSLVEDAIYGPKIATCLPALAVTCLPLCLQCGGGAGMQLASSPLVFAQSFVLWAGQGEH